MNYLLPSYSFDVLMWLVIGGILSVMFHEAGHYLTADKMFLKPDFAGLTVVTKKDGSLRQQSLILFNGVMIGFIPILVMFLLIGWWASALVPLYLLGCKNDIRKYFLIRRKIKIIELGGDD